MIYLTFKIICLAFSCCFSQVKHVSCEETAGVELKPAKYIMTARRILQTRVTFTLQLYIQCTVKTLLLPKHGNSKSKTAEAGHLK